MKPTTQEFTSVELTLTVLNVEQAVVSRYSAASQAKEPSLCCPVNYDARYLQVLPEELIERDYGCGDPSKYVRTGDTVLDLGSGGGKICYIASQIVGPSGRVIGVDMNDEMLALARKYREEIGRRIGWHNVEFFKGRIQDLALDLDRFERFLSQSPVASAADWLAAAQQAERWQRLEPMIAADSIDVVLSNCVLNLVKPEDRRQMFREIHRVLRPGGRAVISDIVSDEPVPERLRQDPELWSGCISGAFVEHELLDEFAAAGFHGIELLERQAEPWAVLEGIEFRSLTVRAFKGPTGPALDQRHAVVYKGPWKSVTDDQGRVLHRGVRTAVCGQSFELYRQPPYATHVIPIAPYQSVPSESAPPFTGHPPIRSAGETKNGALPATKIQTNNSCCSAESSCC